MYEHLKTLRKKMYAFLTFKIGVKFFRKNQTEM
nr:MAG TPA_asm: hypothetical protein [Caudoviricetes sp.]